MRGLLLLWLLIPCLARADEESRTVEAKAHFEHGQRLYQVAKFQEALGEFTAAFEAKPLPEILYNLGQCHRRLGNHDRAAFFFQGYLAALPDASDRAEVEHLVTEEEEARKAREAADRQAAVREELRLRAALAEHDAAHAPSPAPTAPAPAPSPPTLAPSAQEPTNSKVSPVPSPSIIASESVKSSEAVAIAPDPDRVPPRRPIHRRWWFWTGIAVVALAAAAAIFAVTSSAAPALPSGDLGRIDARH